jgi:hypothetical protein
MRIMMKIRTAAPIGERRLKERKVGIEKTELHASACMKQ